MKAKIRKSYSEIKNSKPLYIDMKMPKPIKILSVLKDGCAMCELSKLTDTTYSHVTKIINKFVALGIVNKSKEGRRQEIFITKLGNEYIKASILIMQIYKHIETAKEKR